MPLLPHQRRVGRQLRFPHPSYATEDGFLAYGGDLRPERLLLAYRNGIFPWYSETTPILWWSPPERMVLLPGRIRISRRLARTLRQEVFSLTADTEFERVIAACATVPRPEQDGTWITPEMIRAYCGLHELGFAHSIEVRRDGELVGGLYGVCVNGAFFGESMFSHERDASKVAFAAVAHLMEAWGLHFMDCQIHTAHLERLGAVEITRADFLKRLQRALQAPDRTGSWTETFPVRRTSELANLRRPE